MLLDDLRILNPSILITVENPEHSVFALHPTVRQFTATGHWRLLFSSHCATADPVLDGRVTQHPYSKGLFPQKNTLWLTTNMPRGASLSRCSNNCRMLLPGYDAHRLLICRPAGRALLPGQRVMSMKESRARIPLGAMKQIWSQHLLTKLTSDSSDSNCSKCGGAQNSEEDPLMICDGKDCGRVAHAKCSGFQTVDKAPPIWLCDTCAMRDSRTRGAD